MAKQILVFGSNEAGIHGAGAAKVAYEKHGARWGFSYGHCGDSFAIPTKDQDIRSLSLDRIKMYVDGFLAYAAGHPKLTFKVTRIGCGLAGFKDREIYTMFLNATPNCHFDEAWRPLFEQWAGERNYWGSHNG